MKKRMITILETYSVISHRREKERGFTGVLIPCESILAIADDSRELRQRRGSLAVRV